MNTLYTYSTFIKKFSLAVCFSVLLLAIRIVKTDSIYFTFLVWNLFLACIPFAISVMLRLWKAPKLIFWTIFCIWLLFLPNAPYIITDLQHLRRSTSHIVWFDALLVLSFACNGLVIGFVSLQMMQQELQRFLSKKRSQLFTWGILLLCGFGIYLGRVLRWNSWDILDHPLDLAGDIAKRILFPNQHQETWAFTLGFGVFLILLYQLLYQNVQHSKSVS